MDIVSVTQSNSRLNDLVANLLKAQNNSDTQVSVENSQKRLDVYFEASDNSQNKYETYNKKGQIINSENKTNGVLPEKYSNHLQGYIYYKGERMTQYQFLEKAVASGEYQLDENENVNYNYSKAWKALVEDKAKPLYAWSSTLYSEDGMYVFRVENGEITGASATKLFNGTDILEIANQLAAGISPSEIKGDVSWLVSHDKELYDAATSIGNARKNYENAEIAYKNGEISYSEYLKELKPLFMILFGDSTVSENRISDLKNHYTQNIQDYVKFSFENYDKSRYTNAYS